MQRLALVAADMTLLLGLGATVVLAVKRLFSQFGLALATLLGVISVTVLVMSIPLYVDGVHYRLLREELAGPLIDQDRPPFSFIFHYLSSISGPLRMDDVEAADSYLSTLVSSDLDLPQELWVRFLRTDRMGLFSPDQETYDNPLTRLTTVSVAHIVDLERHITLLDGVLPVLAAAEDGTVDVLLSESLAQKAGFQVDEVYIVFAPREFKNIQFPVRIAGIWRPTDPHEAYWFRDPALFEEVLFTSEATLLSLFGSDMDIEIHEALWYVITDGSDLQANDVGALIVRATRVQAIVSALLPRVIITSPVDALQRFYWAGRALTLQLYVLIVPIVTLNLIFTGLVSGMSVQRRRREIAVMRSRGATRAQVIGLAILEGVMIGLLALALSVPVSKLAARMATRTQSFLNFAGQLAVPVAFDRSTLRLGLVTIGFALLTQVVPTITASRYTVVTYKQERARLLRPPLWQRAWLDLLLLIPAAYGTYQLREQGTLFVPAEGIVVSDPFQNSLLVLVPALSLFALTLFAIRVLPLLVRALAWLIARTRSMSFLLAIRYLSRLPGFYAAPMMLLITTLSLAVFLSAMAQTLDVHLHDQMWYQIGAQLVLNPLIESGEEGDTESQAPPPPSGTADLPNWYYIPLTDYLQVPGVRSAARVNKYRALSQGRGVTDQGTLMGIDRASFAQVAYWRPDFATESLGSLMNRLAIANNGVLLPRDWMHKHGFDIGDSVRLTVSIFGQQSELVLKVAGSFDLFPTWDPEGGPLYVINLDHLYESIGTELPASLWVQVEPAADPEEVRDALHRLNPFSVIRQPLYKGLAAEQGRPERQGLLGVLSTGFVSAALLATVGFFLYTLFSFRRRTIELGTLQSIGLSFWQMARYLAWELVFLVLIGLVGGTALGVVVSRLWIPYFRVGSKAFADVLPMSVQFSWSAVSAIYVLFGLLLVIILAMSVVLSSRLKLYEDVKMIEAT